MGNGKKDNKHTMFIEELARSAYQRSFVALSKDDTPYRKTGFDALSEFDRSRLRNFTQAVIEARAELVKEANKEKGMCSAITKRRISREAQAIARGFIQMLVDVDNGHS